MNSKMTRSNSGCYSNTCCGFFLKILPARVLH